MFPSSKNQLFGVKSKLIDWFVHRGNIVVVSGLAPKEALITFLAALKITTGQRSLTVATVFVTAKKLCRAVTMTVSTYI